MKKNLEPLEPVDSSLRSAVGLGYQLIVAMLLFVGIGYYIDSRHGGGNLYTLLGVAMAFLYGGYEVWKLVKAIEEDDNKESDRDTVDQGKP